MSALNGILDWVVLMLLQTALSVPSPTCLSSATPRPSSARACCCGLDAKASAAEPYAAAAAGQSPNDACTCVRHTAQLLWVWNLITELKRRKAVAKRAVQTPSAIFRMHTLCQQPEHRLPCPISRSGGFNPKFPSALQHIQEHSDREFSSASLETAATHSVQSRISFLNFHTVMAHPHLAQGEVGAGFRRP